MLGKLFKHEWRAAWGILGLLACISLIAVVVGGGCMWGLIAIGDGVFHVSEWLEVMMALVFALAMLAVGVCMVGAFALGLWRFYRGRFTDEGYLTFTLPVSTHQNLIASILNTLCVMVLATVGGMVCYALMITLGLSGYWKLIAQEFRWSGVQEFFRMLLDSIDPGTLGQVLLTIAVSCLESVIVLMLAITIGAMLARKHRLLATAGTYLAINIVLSVLQAAVVVFLSRLNVEYAILGDWFLVANILRSLAISAAGYFLMWWLLEKKLNLN